MEKGRRGDGVRNVAGWVNGELVTQLRLDRIARSAAARGGEDWHTNSALTADSKV
jgi:hypothetical protein